MKVHLDTVGCRLNQAEIESMARQFRAAGYEVVPSAEEADIAVVNTCAVTSAAASDSRGKLRLAARRGAKEVIATGCWATLEPAKAAALPGVARVVPNSQKDQLVEERLRGSVMDVEPLERTPLPGLHHRTRAFIKVQDGCDNHCTFCITTVARGSGRSRPVAEVLSEIHSALAGGAREVVLTGVHLGSWGHDLGSSLHLRDLTKAILRETDVPRLRLSSLEPWDLDEAFFELWADPRLMPHLHLPLQSGCAETLKRMARKTSPESFRRLVEAARKVLPDPAITTDVIVGFPGETEAEFSESLSFVQELQFAGGHVFTYSARPGTGAARLPGQVRMEIRKERSHILHASLEEASRRYRRAFIGRRLPVLWESVSELGEYGWKLEGWTGNYLRVSASAPSPRWNEIDIVSLEAENGGGLEGIIRNS
jgi:threonylcarbamoyladenosine tRNA methylthiotransferase MtaB